MLLLIASCKSLNISGKTENKAVPSSYRNSTDTINSGDLSWKSFFKDQNLIQLIDSALIRNQELNIILQEIAIANNEVLARKGAYLPYLNGGVVSGIDKVGRYTSQGASDHANEITPSKMVPDVLPNYAFGVNISWEVDIWKKLRNARKSSVMRYLSTLEGKNFMVTHLISEIANSYYELIALDNQLEILKSNI